MALLFASSATIAGITPGLKAAMNPGPVVIVTGLGPVLGAIVARATNLSQAIA